jgi:hypothetical protein
MVAVSAMFFIGLAYLSKRWLNQDVVYYCLLVGHMIFYHIIAAKHELSTEQNRKLVYAVVVFSLAYCIGVGHVLYTVLQ